MGVGYRRDLKDDNYRSGQTGAKATEEFGMSLAYLMVIVSGTPAASSWDR